jgi:hypothetical protein
MSTQRFALTPGGPKNLSLVHLKGDEYGVDLDGVRLRSLARVAKSDQLLVLPDGRQLTVRWKPGFGGIGTGWDVLDGDGPLPGSVTDPARLVREAAVAFFLIAGVTALVAGLALAGVGALARIGFGWSDLGFAALYAGVGALVLQRVRAALFFGIGLFALGTVLTYAAVIASGSSSASSGLTGGTFVRVLLFATMIRAVPAIKQQPRRA